MQETYKIIVLPFIHEREGPMYGFLFHSPKLHYTFAVDVGDDEIYTRALAEQSWTLDAIFLTHFHGDHISHAPRLKEKTGATIYGPASIKFVDMVIREGHSDDPVVQVIEAPGHTPDMLNFYVPSAQACFVGDTLTALGCGRLNNCSPETMFNSLQKIKKLPQDTLIYGAHEYALSNLEFALSEFPGNEALQNRAEIIRALRDQGKPTVPSTLGAELATNPFLLAKDAQEFARLRAAKDAF